MMENTDASFTDTDDEQMDVPVSSSNVSASVPSPEEMRTTVTMNRDSKTSGGSSRFLKLLVAAVVIAAVVVGVVIGVTSGGDSNDQPSPSVQGDSNPQVSNPQGSTTNTRKSSADEVIAIMANLGVSSLVALKTLGTPQNRAAFWLAETDGANLVIPTDFDTGGVELYKYTTRYAMAVLYYSTGGDTTWKDQVGFMSSLDVCEWYAIFLNGSNSYRKGVLCEPETGFITGLGIKFNGMSGTLPPELGVLETLQQLILNENSELGGEIPVQICYLLELVELELIYNRLQGRIPACLGTMVALEYLLLSNNALTGPLPQAIGGLLNMKSIIVDDNMLTGDITDFFDNLVNLESLHLEDNYFGATISDSFLVNQVNLVTMDLSTNKLQGTLPLHLLSHPKLLVIDLHSNHLTNSIPQPIPENNKLLLLSIHNNLMTGALPPSLVNLQSLLHIDVSSNGFTGFIPEEIGSLVNLRYFFASANYFTPAVIPEFLAGLHNLEEIGLKSTSRIGEIPSFLGDLTELILLDLDDNTLSGPLPSELGQLSKLQFLLLNRNALTGEIPAEFSGLTELRLAFLDRNALTGSMAPMCQLSNFHEFADDIDGTELITADCIGPDKEIECICCTVCCNDLFQVCHDFTDVPTLDPMWEHSSNRLTYSFGDTSFFFSTDVLP